jgi:hypothetical protein
MSMKYAFWCIVVYIFCRTDLEGWVGWVPCNGCHIRVIVEMLTHAAFRAATDELEEACMMKSDASLAGTHWVS